MKSIPRLIRSLLSATAVLLMTGCTSWDASSQEQMLSASGFSIKTPETAKQKEIYNAMEPYKLVSGTVNGKLLFAYKQEKKGVVYVGNESNYQQYQKLAMQRNIAQQQIMAAQMNRDMMMNWGYWGPRSRYWW